MRNGRDTEVNGHRGESWMAAAGADGWVNGERRLPAVRSSFFIPELGRCGGLTARLRCTKSLSSWMIARTCGF